MKGLYVTAIGPRAEEWRRVFGDDRLPVTSIHTVTAELEGLGKREVFFLDFTRLDPTQLDSLISHLGKNYPEDAPDWIRATILARGFPIYVDENLLQPAIDMRFIV